MRRRPAHARGTAVNPYPSTKGATTEPTVETKTDAPSIDHAITADHTRRYAAASTGLSRLSSATIRRWRARRKTRHQANSLVHDWIASADSISGSRSASSRNDALACKNVATRASNDEINVHDHMPQSMTPGTDTWRPNG